MVTEYFNLMKETAQVVHPLVRMYLDRFKESKGKLYDIISQIPQAFMKQGSNFRTYLLRASYQSLTEKDWKWIAPIGASIEFLLSSMYYANWIQDEKGGKRSRDEDKNILTAAFLMRDLKGVALYEMGDRLPLEKLVAVSCLLNESNRIFHEGQFIDINVNTYQNPNKPLSESGMNDLFFERTYKINAAFIERIAKIGGMLAEGSNEQINALSEFGKNFGIAHQIMNDIADFVPAKAGISTTTKIPDDAYTDIRNGHLTIPVIYTLYHDSDKERVKKIIQILEKGKEIPPEQIEEVTPLLIQNGAIDYTISYAREFKKKAKNSIRDFPENKRKLLDWLLISIDSNKYYTFLRGIKNDLK
ncbi:MAG: polyprenyl synthetase family protein [Nanoarchaeota archaeon]